MGTNGFERPSNPEIKSMLTESPSIAQLFTVDEDFNFTGLTPEGVARLKARRDAIKMRFRLFDDEFKNLRGLHFTSTLARLAESNMFVYGPPGGAKSALISWIMKSEGEVYVRQMHQMLTEQTFLGGEVLEKVMRGESEINTKGSLVEFRVALIDEIEKGNPAVLASLLSLLNERKVFAGNRIINAKTETVFATSNASLSEFFDSFVESGQRSTAPALLNRFQFKAFIYNWLESRHQIELDARRECKKYLEAVNKVNPKAGDDQLFIDTPKVNWEDLRLLDRVMVESTPLFKIASQTLANSLREETNRHIRESEAAHASNPRENPVVYFPSFDYTERNRQQIPDIVRYSLFLDFLLSDQSEDKNLKFYQKIGLQMTAMSLWRAYNMMTTVSMGSPYLSKLTLASSSANKGKEKGVVEPESKENFKLKIAGEETQIHLDYDFKINVYHSRDTREQGLLENIIYEQKIFNDQFVRVLNEVKGAIQTVVDVSESNSSDMDLSKDFELLMMEEHSR